MLKSRLGLVSRKVWSILLKTPRICASADLRSGITIYVLVSFLVSLSWFPVGPSPLFGISLDEGNGLVDRVCFSILPFFGFHGDV